MSQSRTLPADPGVYQSFIAVGVGGSIGAIARYLIGRQVADLWPSAFPWGTLLVNVTGCVALGILLGRLQRRGDEPLMRLVIGTGVLGAYTTFSTFAYETVRLFEDGSWVSAMSYIAASLVLCVGGAAAGRRIGQ